MTIGCLGLALAGFANAQDNKETATTKVKELASLNVTSSAKSKASHGLGYLKGRELALELMKSGYQLKDFSNEDFVKGFSEALTLKDSTVKSKELKVAVDLMKAHLQERESKLATQNKAAAVKWLAENAKKKGIKTTKSGLQYEVVETGKGEVYKAPQKGEQPKRFLITYEGSDFEGKVFERIGGDKVVAVGEQGIPGLIEALKIMPVGSTWKLYLKPSLAYGERRLNSVVAPNTGVIFKVKLEAIKELEVRK